MQSANLDEQMISEQQLCESLIQHTAHEQTIAKASSISETTCLPRKIMSESIRTTNPLQANLLQRALTEFEQSSQRECMTPQKQSPYSSFSLDQSSSLVPTHMG